MRDTCDIFKCNFQSLARWVKKYKQKGNLNSPEKWVKWVTICLEYMI